MFLHATVLAVLYAVLRAHDASEKCTVYFDFAFKRFVLGFSRQGFAQLVAKHEGSLVLNVQIAGELDSRHALCAVDEQADRGQQIDKCQLREAKIVPDVTENCAPQAAHLNLRRVGMS